MKARTCLRCGCELPTWCSPSVSYCVDCRQKIHNEMLARHHAEYMKRQATKQETLDRKYCSECRYHSGEYGENLCDYILHTGKRRGCRAGEGCEKREPKQVIDKSEEHHPKKERRKRK